MPRILIEFFEASIVIPVLHLRKVRLRIIHLLKGRELVSGEADSSKLLVFKPVLSPPPPRSHPEESRAAPAREVL